MRRAKFLFVLSVLICVWTNRCWARPPSVILRCLSKAPTLEQVLRAYDRRCGAQAAQARALALAKRARRSAWLPQLLLSAEHRQRQDQDRDTEVAAALKFQDRRGQGQVFRAQMRWNLDRLVHHHASLSALRFARTLAQAHRQDRRALAQSYARWRRIWEQGCKATPSDVQLDASAQLRAEVIAATGLRLPKLAQARVVVQDSPKGRPLNLQRSDQSGHRP